MEGVPPRAPRLKAPLLLLVWCLPHCVVERLAQERLDGGVRVGGQATKLAAHLRSEIARHARLADAAGLGPRAGRRLGWVGVGLVHAVRHRRLTEDGVAQVGGFAHWR